MFSSFHRYFFFHSPCGSGTGREGDQRLRRCAALWGFNVFVSFPFACFTPSNWHLFALSPLRCCCLLISLKKKRNMEFSQAFLLQCFDLFPSLHFLTYKYRRRKQRDDRVFFLGYFHTKTACFHRPFPIASRTD